jgi:hypothetical protein
MKEVLALYKKVIGNYRPLLDGERYLTDKEAASILKVSSLDRTAVVRITLTEPPVGKRKQYDKQGEEFKYGRME